VVKRGGQISYHLEEVRKERGLELKLPLEIMVGNIGVHKNLKVG